jgi:hypothetical protein
MSDAASHLYSMFHTLTVLLLLSTTTLFRWMMQRLDQCIENNPGIEAGGCFLIRTGDDQTSTSTRTSHVNQLSVLADELNATCNNFVYSSLASAPDIDGKERASSPTLVRLHVGLRHFSTMVCRIVSSREERRETRWYCVWPRRTLRPFPPPSPRNRRRRATREYLDMRCRCDQRGRRTRTEPALSLQQRPSSQMIAQ